MSAFWGEIAGAGTELSRTRHLRHRDTTQWRDGELLDFIRSCLRHKGTEIHDAMEPIIEGELDRRIARLKERIASLVREARERESINGNSD